MSDAIIRMPQFLKGAAFALVALVVLAAEAWKFRMLEAFSAAMFECSFCLSRDALPYEAQFLAIVVALHLLSSSVPSRWMRVPMRLGVAALVVVFLMDLVVTTQFATRFTWVELRKFAFEFEAIGTFLRQLFTNPWRAAVAVAGVSALFVILGWYVLEQPATSRRSRWIWVVIPVAIYAALIPLRAAAFHASYLRNSAEAFFLRQTNNVPYSATFAAALPPGPAPSCRAGLGERPDIVLVVVESLSMFQSRRFSGLNDWTPRIDEWSAKGTAFKHFASNGLTTEDGLVALLTGEPPIPRAFPDGTSRFEQFAVPRESVPGFLRQAGYDTAFLTTGDVSFLGMGRWLETLGFATVEGHTAHFYDGMERLGFNAAPDGALYDRALQFMQADAAKPRFIVLNTVSTHQPYLDPETKQRGQQAAVRYADRKLGAFMDTLDQRGFFEKGYVMVVGDHRAMLPQQPGERALLGDRAYASTPFFVVGSSAGSPPTTIDSPFSQTDLLPSLRYWVGSGKQCFDANQGIFLPRASQQQAPGCVFTRRPYDNDLVVAQCGPQDFTIRLAGNATSFEGKTGPAEVLAQVHRLRLGRGFQGAR